MADLDVEASHLAGAPRFRVPSGPEAPKDQQAREQPPREAQKIHADGIELRGPARINSQSPSLTPREDGSSLGKSWRLLSLQSTRYTNHEKFLGDRKGGSRRPDAIFLCVNRDGTAAERRWPPGKHRDPPRYQSPNPFGTWYQIRAIGRRGVPPWLRGCSTAPLPGSVRPVHQKSRHQAGIPGCVEYLHLNAPNAPLVEVEPRGGPPLDFGLVAKVYRGPFSE